MANIKNMTVPAEIARQTLIQLAKNSLPPTPENYTAAYKEIAGSKAIDAPSVNKTLQKVLADVSKQHPKFIEIEEAINKAVKKQDWAGLETQFRKLLLETMKETTASEVNWSTLIRTLLKQLETSHKGITLSRKKDGLSRVLTNFSKDPVVLADKVQALIQSWGSVTATSDIEVSASNPENELAPADNTNPTTLNRTQIDITSSHLRDMLIRTLNLAIIPILEDVPTPHINAQNLLEQLRNNSTGQALTKNTHDLKGILLTVETELENKQNIQHTLVDLLGLLVKSMEELVGADQWLAGQIAIVTDILSKPISFTSLQNAESSLKELIHKQSNIKPAVLDAQELLKQMATTFISRLVDITESTDDYHHKIETHQKKLSNINSIDELNGVLKNVLDDTKTIGLTVQRTREDFKDSQIKIDEAEKKILELSSVLEYINEVANEDYLTGTLNRRGMEDALEREFNRADRHHTALSIAMMDIDHFKSINDQLGHNTGDQALIHFANVIKTVKRTTDILARYGGEEFIIILPNTEQDDAIKVIERVQRKLTKEFFLHSNQHVVITFSAGVAQRYDSESPDDIIPRADIALYEAKNSGRNRVIGASIDETKTLNSNELRQSEITLPNASH
jgi:diguanylate cyclase